MFLGGAKNQSFYKHVVQPAGVSLCLTQESYRMLMTNKGASPVS